MGVFFFKEKSDAYHHFNIFKNLAESECGERINFFRTDRGGEFNSEEFRNFYDMNGIKRHFTAPYSPQQNGVVERKNRTIMSCVRSMMKEKRLPLELWAEAVNTYVYVLNRSFTKSLLDSTPYEKWSGRKTLVDHLRVFGLVVHVKIDGYYVAYKPITLSSILCMFVEMKFIHCHSCVMFAMKSMSMCND